MSSVQLILDKDFQERFRITEVIKHFEWWQKRVFVVNVWWVIQVVKIYKDFWKRDIRELDIYEKYKDNKFLPKIIDVVEYNGDTVVFEKLIDGKTLEECKDDYRWNSNLIIQLIIDITSVLELIWKDWITHRDIKPSNIIIVSWKPYVIDFWIAWKVNWTSFTEAWFQPKTFKFTSPEQILWLKDHVTYRSDFFSIWILAYYLYYWNLPFWEDPEAIKKMIDSWVLDYSSSEDCNLNKFFSQLLLHKPHSRPRNVPLLLNLLPSL